MAERGDRDIFAVFLLPAKVKIKANFVALPALLCRCFFYGIKIRDIKKAVQHARLSNFNTKNYIGFVVVVVVLVFNVVSFTVLSFTTVSTLLVSVTAIPPSLVMEVSEPSPPDLLELQAATDRVIAKAKKPNLKVFFMGSII